MVAPDQNIFDQIDRIMLASPDIIETAKASAFAELFNQMSRTG
jgi:hypothetical protein